MDAMAPGRDPDAPTPDEILDGTPELSGAELQLLRRAVGGRWPIPAKMRPALVASLLATALSAESDRDRNSAAKVLASMDKLNMDLDKREDGVAEQHEHRHVHEHHIDLATLTDEQLADSPQESPSPYRMAALAEIELRRRRREKTFDHWLAEVSPTWTWSWPHLRHMRDRLAEVTAGRVRFLMQFCPPRHGKTEQNTVRYAAYRLERNPTTRIIIAAYNAKLAKKFSRKVKALIKGRVELNPNVQASDEWETAAGGGVRAAGIRTGVTGFGADLIIIDDPIKGRVEANSSAFREQLWDTFTDDLFTRLEPGGAILVTLTRWHEADLAGAILKSEIGRDWVVVNLPAIAEADDPLGRAPGEALCPDRYPIEELQRRKRLMRGNFYALFQGQPRPAEGNAYQRTWFRYWTRDEKSPDLVRLDRGDGRTRLVKLADCRLFITCDPATSEKRQADYTVFSTWAVTPDGDLILLDRERVQESSPDVLKRAFALQRRWKPSHFSVGAGGIGLPLIQNMRAGFTYDDGTRCPGLTVRAVPDQADKLTKATTALIRTEAGQVFFPADAEWLREWEDELLSFPNGAHKDQADTLSTAAEEVFIVGGAEEPEEQRLAREEDEREAEERERAERLEALKADHTAREWWPDEDDE